MYRIKHAVGCSGYYTPQYLVNFGIVDFYRLLGTRKIIAIRNPQMAGFNMQSIKRVGIMESKPQPLYKQAMQLQMGRIPRNVESIRQYNVEYLSIEEVNDYHIEVYDIQL